MKGLLFLDVGTDMMLMIATDVATLDSETIDTC